MKKILFLILFVILYQPIICAYKIQDLTRLKQTCSCPHGDLSGADLANFILGDNKTLIPKIAIKDKNGFIVCHLEGANFNRANLTKSYFSPADFGPGINPKVGQIRLMDATFKGANLQGSHFNAVMADQANFEHANMTNMTILQHASFNAANFSHAVMTNLSVSPPMGGCGATFKGSNFFRSNLANSKINADFDQANFSYANLQKATLTSCDLSPQNSFNQTNFYGANLRDTHYQNQPFTEQLLVSARLCRTILSAGVSNRNCDWSAGTAKKSNSAIQPPKL